MQSPKRNRVIVVPGWLEKEEAAERLGVGMRQLENRAKKGEIRKNKLTRQPNERAARVLYSIEDIDAILEGHPSQYGAPKPPAPAAPSALALVPAAPVAAAGSDLIREHTARVLARLAAAFPPEPTKPWLTLDEAAAWSGLPAAWLLERARAGLIQAVNVGQGSKARWRFNRAALAK